MKLEVVIQVSSMKRNNCSKCRFKAMQIAAAADGVESVSFKDDESQLELTGESVDVVSLLGVLRKKLHFANLLRVSPAEGEKKEENANNGSGGGDDGNNGSGGGKNNKKGSDHDGNGDKYKNGGETKGKNMDSIGKAGFSYGFGYLYHAGNENEYPVGQLQCTQEVRSSELKCLIYHAIMIS